MRIWSGKEDWSKIAFSVFAAVLVRGSYRSEPQLRAELEGVVIVHRRRGIEVERRARPDRGGVVAVVHDGGRGGAVAVAVGVGRCRPRLHQPPPNSRLRRRRRSSPGRPAGPAGGLDGGAGAARGRGRRRRDEAAAVVAGGGAGEVGPGERAAQGPRGDVVGARRGLGGVEGAEPDARALRRVADLRREPAPRALPHAPVPRRRHRHGRRAAPHPARSATELPDQKQSRRRAARLFVLSRSARESTARGWLSGEAREEEDAVWSGLAGERRG
ncbi:hypothetical protein GQ55_7G324700 [Panicum hallii var. hallii]|uniref:Uncharacterized protein n=1 Tax=Panicum hallii var. hallii TaxID=1504633 RepID=A0A2T7D1G2_9POAL|nr:hypothetical protein GQ55_7G324700 [Panicum hallii var. hallii]